MVAATEIQIDTTKAKQGPYTSGLIGQGAGKVNIDVTEEKPWDKLSKIFKKYTHTIRYPGGGGVRYKSSEYSITLIGPSRLGSTGSSNKFTYMSPRELVRKVEVYFWADDDVANKAPLVVGFISPNWSHSNMTLRSNRTKGCPSSSGTGLGSKCYYTWRYLTKQKHFHGDINEDNAISEKDLVTVLLEELGTSDTYRPNKLVIRLDERPHSSSEYPESAYFTRGERQSSGNRKITVKKDNVYVMDDTVYGESKDVEGYVKYEHTIPDCDNEVELEDVAEEADGAGCGVEDLYVSYGNNSRFFQVAQRTGSGSVSGSGLKDAKIKSVTAYFETETNKLVLITFTLSTGIRSESTHEHKYFDFVNDLKDLRARSNWATDVKTILTDGLDALPTVGHGGSALKTRLEQESERLRELIAFVQDNSGTKNNENIRISQVTFGSKIMFTKVTMIPDKTDKGAGFAVGPWYVYNSQLFTNNEGDKIDTDATIEVPVLKGIFTDGDTGHSSSRDKKYSSISVYYVVTGYDNSKYSALLVEFEKASTSGIGGGDKIYFKRVKQGSKVTQWERALDIGIGTSDTNQLVQKLTQIAKQAKIIEENGITREADGGIVSSDSSDMMTKAKEIQIETKAKTLYSSGRGGAYVSEVTPYNPWDKLSRLFKVYVHTIKYPGDGGVYNIALIGSGGSRFDYKPTKKVTKVELYFRANDFSNSKPLVVGFVYSNSSDGSSEYYTWSYLKSTRSTKHGDIDTNNAIKENDLIHGLLEELGRTTGGGGAAGMPGHNTGGKNKVVIRLGEQPTSSSTYPGSAYFTKGVRSSSRKITVKKAGSGVTVGDAKVDGCVGYEHTVDTGADSVDGFYVTYDNNSMYIVTGTEIERGLVSRSGSRSRVVSEQARAGSWLGSRVVSWLGRGLVSWLGRGLGPRVGFRVGSRSWSVSRPGSESWSWSVSRAGYGRVGAGSWSVSGSWLKYGGLKKVTAYFDTTGGIGSTIVSNSKRLVLIVFSFKGGSDGGSTGVTYVYPYSDFVNDVRDLRGGSNWFTAANTIRGGDVISGGNGGGGTKIYYRRDNQDSSTWASVGDIGTSDEEELRRILQQEKERLKHLIEFKKGDGSTSSTSSLVSGKIGTDSRDSTVGTTGTGRISPVSTGHKHIKTTGPVPVDGQDNVDQGYKFMKVTMTANTDDAKGGRPGGPWTVYSGYLFTDNRGKKIDEDANIEDVGVLGDMTKNKHQSIAVYYVVTVGSGSSSGRKSSALLVEFCAGDGDKKYIKRVKGGDKWADAKSDISGNSGNVDEKVLTDIAKKAGIIVDGGSGIPGPIGPAGPADHSAGGGGGGAGAECVSDSNASSRVEAGGGDGGGSSVRSEEASSSSNTDNDGGSSSSDSSIPGIATGVVGVGAGAGYAVYKNLGAVMGLIGRIAGR